MKAVIHRLRRLETQFAPAIEAGRPERPSPLPRIIAALDKWGIVRGEKESVCEALARALGWTSRQLRAELMRRAGLGRVSPRQ
jgi:hypothetical protein